MKRHLAILTALLVAGLFVLPVAATAAEHHHTSRQAAWSGHDREFRHQQRHQRWERRERERNRHWRQERRRQERRQAWRNHERRERRANHRVVILPPPPRVVARILLPPPPAVIFGGLRLW